MDSEAQLMKSSLRSKITSLLAALAMTALLAGCVIINPDNNQSTFDPRGPVADSQLNIFWWILAGGMIVFVLVEAVLIYSIFKYRMKSEDDIPQQTHGNHKLEITSVSYTHLTLPTICSV